MLLLFGTGLLLIGFWDSPHLPLRAKVLVLALFFGGQFSIYCRNYGDFARRELPPPPEIASVIRDTIPPEGVVLIYGWDWNSLVPYYAERRAVMVPVDREDQIQVLDQILEKLPPRRVAAMLVRRDKFDASPVFLRKRASRFGLSPAPFATSTDGDLYLPPADFARATAQLADQKFQNVILQTAPAAASDEPELKEFDFPAIDLSLINPKPIRCRSLYGISNDQTGGRPVLNAHAPSEVWIVPPVGAIHLTAEFGLAEGAYTGAAPLTDGIGITISEIHSGQEPRVLYHRELDPVRNPDDRGTQKTELTGAEPFTGQLVFKIDPGPKDSLVKDWAYWAGIEIR